MEGYFEQVVERLTGAGYRWYETANFCRSTSRGGRTSARATTSPTGSGATTSASGSARSRRRRARAGGTRPRLARYVAALARASRRRASWSRSTTRSAIRERVMLGLRLDEPLPVAEVDDAIDGGALARLERLGLVERGRRRSRSPGGAASSAAASRPSSSPSLNFLQMSGAWNEQSSRSGSGDPAPRRRGVRRDRRAGRLEGRSSSDAGSTSRRRRFATSSPSSRRSGCSRIRTRRPAGSRPSAATATTPTGCSSGSSRGRAALPARPAATRAARSTTALQSTTEMLSQVTRLLALVSAPAARDGDGPARRGAAAAAAGRDGRC